MLCVFFFSTVTFQIVSYEMGTEGGSFSLQVVGILGLDISRFNRFETQSYAMESMRHMRHALQGL